MNAIEDHVPTSVPFYLTDHAEIQEGNVVEVLLAENDAAEITLLAIAEDERLGSHPAPADLIFTVLEGRLQVHLPGETVMVDRGQSIALNEGTRYSLKAMAPSKVLSILLEEAEEEGDED